MRDTVKFIGFNQDSNFLAVGDGQGYRIFGTDPEHFSIEPFVEKKCGGISSIAMLGRTSLLCLVGSGDARRLQLYNNKAQSIICNITFADVILSVKLSRKRLVVVLEKCLHIFDVTNMSPLQILDTERNERGLAAISQSEEQCLIAYPGSLEQGSGRGDLMIVDGMTGKTMTVIRAHDAPLAAIAISASGTRLATASCTGTLIRVWKIGGGDEAPLAGTYKRGTASANIYSLSFNVGPGNPTLLAVSSSSSTVHVFKCDDGARSHVANKEASLWRCKVKGDTKETPNTVAISSDSKRVMLATRDGNFFCYEMDPNATKETWCQLVKEERLARPQPSADRGMRSTGVLR